MSTNLKALAEKALVAACVARNKTDDELRAEQAARARDRVAYVKEVLDEECEAGVRFSYERFRAP